MPDDEAQGQPFPDATADVALPVPTADLHARVMNCTFSAIAAISREGEFLFVNNRACEIMGYSRQELGHIHFSRLLQPDDLSRVARTIQTAMTQGTRFQRVEAAVRRKDGAARDVVFNLDPLTDDAGNVLAVVATAEDVTEQRRASRLLNFQRDILEILALEPAENAALEAIARCVHEHVGRRTVIFAANQAASALRPVATAGVSDELKEAIETVRVGASAGACGTSIFRKASVISHDVSSDDLWSDFRGLAEAHDIRSAWAIPIFSPDGDPVGTLSTYGAEPASPDEWQQRALDAAARLAGVAITREQHRTMLHAQEERYSRLWESSSDAIIVIDAGNTIVSASPATAAVFGYTPEELVGQSLSVLQPERFRDDHLDGLRRYLASGERRIDWRSQQLTGLHRDGHEFPLEVSYSDTSFGDTRMLAGIMRDVTNRVRTEDALRASELRFRSLAENAFDMVCELDSDGRFIYVSPNFKSILGYDPPSLIGRSPWEIIHQDDSQAVTDSFRNLVEFERRPGSAAFRIRREDGTWCWVEVSANITTTDAGDRVIIVARDIAERMRAEAVIAAQRHLLELIAVGTPLEQVLHEIVVTVEAHAPGTVASVLLTSSDGTHLRCAAAPSLPEAFARSADGLPIGPNAGSCGTAAYRNETVIVTDIEHDSRWAGASELALSHGLRACWSTPITASSGSVLGTLAMYYRECREPADAEREIVSVAAHLAGIAIERRRSEQAVRSRTAELERMYKRLTRTHVDLEDSKLRLEEKSRLLQAALDTERERARRDQLTGALNHAAITDMLREIVELRDARPHAVAMVDVDGLKIANDTFGHQLGDALLIKVAEILARPGTTVGRYGGDEFVVIIPGADRAAAESYRDDVARLMASAGLTDAMTNARIPVVASIGMAIYPDEAQTVEDLIRLSDSAMYQSRRLRPDDAQSGLARPLGGDRAARMVGELVPLLTSPGDLQDKLRLVAHRLSIGAGYDAVNFALSDDATSGFASSSFARVPEDFLERWNRSQRASRNTQMARILEHSQRPMILEDLEADERLDEEERAMLTSVGLRSALCAPMIWENSLIGVLTVASARRGAFSVRDADFVAAVATQVTAIVRMSTLVDQLRSSTGQLKQAHESTVLMLASAAEAHDATTGSHLSRVRQISEALARELGYEEDAARAMGMAATLHDIGKIRVPDSVLGSAASLQEAEWVLMKQHTIWGGAFLAGKPGFELAATVARYHHERWDGTGYPDGLSGTRIPEAALICTVADSIDAMTSNRPYRHGRPLSEAIDEIVRCSGTQFSPIIVDALVRLYDRGELAFVEDHTDDDLHEAIAA